MPAITTALEPVLLDGERIASIGTITIDNPDRRNAMTAAMYSAIPTACATLCAEPDLRAVMLRGAGNRAFCAGSDISEFRERRMGDGATTYDSAEHQAWDALAAIGGPDRSGDSRPLSGRRVLHSPFTATSVSQQTPPSSAFHPRTSASTTHPRRPVDWWR